MRVSGIHYFDDIILLNLINHCKLCISNTECFYVMWEFKTPLNVLSTNNINNNTNNNNKSEFHLISSTYKLKCS